MGFSYFFDIVDMIFIHNKILLRLLDIIAKAEKKGYDVAKA